MADRSSGRSENMVPGDNGNGYYAIYIYVYIVQCERVRLVRRFNDPQKYLEKARNGMTSLLASGHQGPDKEKRGELIRSSEFSAFAGSIRDSNGHLMLPCHLALARQGPLQSVGVNRCHSTCIVLSLFGRLYKGQCFLPSFHLINHNLIAVCSSSKHETKTEFDRYLSFDNSLLKNF